MATLNLNGNSIPVDGLRYPKAVALAKSLKQGAVEFARLADVQQKDSFEFVLFDVDVERPQKVAYDIRPVETIAAVFTANDDQHIEVLALRSDFPGDAPHINARNFERPKSLCLYEVPYDDVRISWTPASFVSRIRWWLGQTSRGELHGADQPLEPLLLPDSGRIIVPRDWAPSSALPEELRVIAVHDTEGPLTLVVAPTPLAGQMAKFVVLGVRAVPQTHGAIRRVPRALSELCTIVEPLGIDLRRALRVWLRDSMDRREIRKAMLVVVLDAPKTRIHGGAVEGSEMIAFALGVRIEQLGAELGVWQHRTGDDVGLLVPVDESMTGDEISVETLGVVRGTNAADVSRYCGHDSAFQGNVTCVGGGALGSQIAILGARTAFGRWIVVDNDTVLPHNIARHSAFRTDVGHTKAEVVARLAVSAMPEGAAPARGIYADVLRDSPRRSDALGAITESVVIVDTSASVAVARFLARDVGGHGRRVSAFLNPTGTSLTVLAEDARRSTTLDVLEMQHYRALTRDDVLRHHFEPQARVRYGTGCRDISTIMPSENISLFAALALKAIRAAHAREDASADEWIMPNDHFDVRHVHIPIASPIETRVGGWSIVTDTFVMGRLEQLREKGLPNETGGVLIGAWDTQRGIVYIVDALRSPSDSTEWPTLYIRGVRGVVDDVAEISARTGSQLGYVGEWHSHPDNVSPAASETDTLAMKGLAGKMRGDDLPAVIAIASDHGRVAVHIMPSDTQTILSVELSRDAPLRGVTG